MDKIYNNNNAQINVSVGNFTGKEVRNLLAKLNMLNTKVSILGDSYSTFSGYIPQGYPSWYPANTLTSVDKTWWYQVIKAMFCSLEINSSYSGSEVCNMRTTASSFIARKDTIGNPDILFIFGGTNDEWRVRDSPAEGYQTYEEMLGEYKYSNFTDEDLKHFRPALAYLFDYYKTTHPQMRIVFVLNDALIHIVESVYTICEHYQVPLVHLAGIRKANEHPNADGSKDIAKEIVTFWGGEM